jgi:hypothetical protein
VILQGFFLHLSFSSSLPSFPPSLLPCPHPAVNHKLGKNMIGAFYQPQCVIIDTDTLSTLPDRELASGIAEIVKYGLIRCVLPPFPCMVLPLSSLHLLF